MEQKYLDALQAIADKLGTTATHLWSVTVAQAPMAAAFNFLMVVLVVAVTVVAVIYVHKKTTPRAEGYEPDWVDEASGFAWLGVALLVIFCFIVVGCSGNSILAGFFNPEYWALTDILDKAKP